MQSRELLRQFREAPWTGETDVDAFIAEAGTVEPSDILKVVDLFASRCTAQDVGWIRTRSMAVFRHESVHAVVTQRQVGVHTESLAAALRSALRESPDVLIVGEMRDLETISLAMSAAETGVLVFGTLHTNSAGVPPMLIIAPLLPICGGDRA